VRLLLTKFSANPDHPDRGTYPLYGKLVATRALVDGPCG
jgi:hypothetical protein